MSALWPVLTGPPGAGCWDFGGYPYGLEPLTLPEPGVWSEPPGARRHGPAPPVSLVGDFGVPAQLSDEPVAAETLYWFRWITGHQVSFVLWRLIGQLVNEVTAGRLPPAEAVTPLRHHIRGYCAMLLYSGSCPHRTYELVIRPSMRLRHPAFSGSLAPDFWPVRDLLRGRRTVFTELAEAAELFEAVELHRLVHEVVAARLVPDGVSLLRQSKVRPWDLRVLRLLYDNYFLTMRAPVGEEAVVAQLMRRLVAIARDIEVNGLYPHGAQTADRAWESDVVACEIGLAATLDDVANAATDTAAHVPGAVV